LSACKVSVEASRDLREIWKFIARDNERAADRVYVKVYDTFRSLGRNPSMGRERGDIRLGLRSFPVGEYLILYRVASPGVRIVRVVHGRRDLARLFR
jgi:toxin ParE1/3/4